MAVMRYQPQGMLRIAPGSLAAGLRLAILPGVNRGYDAVSGRLVTVTGTKLVPSVTGLAAGFGAALGAGSTDRMTTGLSGAFPSTGRSYFFRARRNGAGGSSLGRLFDKTNGGTGQMLYWYGSQARLVYSFYMGGAERVTEIPGTNITAAAGEWFDVLVTHNQVGSNATLNAWVNGVQVLADFPLSGTFNDATATPLSIGNRADGVRGWDGSIECAYLWDRILTADDAAMLSANRYQLFASTAAEDDDEVAAAPKGYTLSAEAGSFAVSGVPASLRTSRKVPTSSASFGTTAGQCGLHTSRRLAAVAGSFQLADASAMVLANRRISAGPAVFALVGRNASLTYTAAPLADGPAYALAAETGSFAVTSGAVVFRASRKLITTAGTIAVAGAPAPFLAQRRIAIAAESMTLASSPAALPATRRMGVSGGVFAIAGAETAFTYGALIEYARAPAGRGYAPQRTGYQSRPAQHSGARPAEIQAGTREPATQENYR